MVRASHRKEKVMAVNETEKLTRIRQEFQQDLRDMPPALTLEDVPAFYECITREWLTAVVRLRYPDATVTGFRLGERDSGTTNRRRIFLEYVGEHAGKPWPRSFFCKAAQDLANRITMSAGSAMGETQFYNQIRPQLSIDAPTAYFAKVDPHSFRAIIVLEDLGDEAEFCTYQTHINDARARSQISLMARMHGRFYGQVATSPSLAAIDSFPDRFHRIAEYHGLEEACTRGLFAAGPVMPSSLMERAGEVWPATLQGIEMFHHLPSTLTHGDIHLGNWYVRPGDRMGLTDFQNVTTGHWSRDLAYTIVTSLDIETRRQTERDLISSYLEELREHGGAQESFDSAWRNYRQQMLTVLAWWTVTLTPSSTMAQDMQTEETTLCFLERIGAAIADLDVLDSFA
jgi:aminoglycoside/choline kinase family phosphotransferase